MPFVSLNPATGRRIATYPLHRPAEVERLLARAAAAQARWRSAPLAERAAAINGLGAQLRACQRALAKLAAEEMGKPVMAGEGEVEKCAFLCDFFAEHGPALLADQRPPHAPRHARVAFEPLGVVLAIMPWNFPYWQVVRAAIPALLAGNTVLLKHAPSVTGCALAITSLFRRAGFPPGVFQCLLIDPPAIGAVIADRRVAGVTLTGSVRAGRAVAAQAGDALKPVVLELGGSDPILVLDDADLDHAAETAAQARLINSGQSCICGKRVIVVRPRLREFTERFVARIAARRLGDPLARDTDLGPLARADLRDAIHDQVERSRSKGARVLLEGGPQPGPGFFYAPVVLGNVKPGMAAFDEETFGPVGAVIAARDEREAVRLANQTAFGLGAALFTRDTARARRIAAELQAGCVFVNELVRSSPELPFGGIKDSGIGRELGAWGVHSFTNIKTIVGA